MNPIALITFTIGILVTVAVAAASFIGGVVFAFVIQDSEEKSTTPAKS